MTATRVVRTLDVSAASGLVLREGSFHIVADDENALYVSSPDGAPRIVDLALGMCDEVPWSCSDSSIPCQR